MSKASNNKPSAGSSDAVDVVITGTFKGAENLAPDLAAQRAIDILCKAAEEDPYKLLNTIYQAVETRLDGMVAIALACLTSRASEGFLNEPKTNGTLLTIFGTYEPPVLLEYVEMMKSKMFGRGFGSRPQKWIRQVMESWNVTTIDAYLTVDGASFYHLIRLVHPRYNGVRGQLVKELLNSVQSK